MKNFVVLFFLLLLACQKEDCGTKPEIIWRMEFPSSMPSGNWKSSPIIYKDFLIVAIGDPESRTSSLYKFSKDDGSFIAQWEETVPDIIGCSFYLGEKYLYKNLLISKNECDEVIAVNLNTMKTVWKIDAFNSQNRLYSLDGKVFTVEYTNGGLNIYEIDIEKQQKSFVYYVPPVEYGFFVEVQKPYFYREGSSDRLVIATQKDSAFILINYNITKSTVVWEVKMDEFKNSEATPCDISSTNDYIIISSNDYISCRNKFNGDYHWSKSRDVTFNVEEPLVTEEVILSATEKLYCYDNAKGYVVWSREYGDDGIKWGSSANLGFMGGLFFICGSPLNPANGNPYWFDFDQWGNLDLPFYHLPAYDKVDDALYYTNMSAIYKVKKPG